MIIEIRGYLVDTDRLVVPRPGSRAARAWFERGPPSAGNAPDEPEPWDGTRTPSERASPATARRGWVVIPGGVSARS